MQEIIDDIYLDGRHYDRLFADGHEDLAFWVNLDMLYRDGARAKVVGFRYWVGRDAFRWLQRWLYSGTDANWTRTSFMGVGALLTMLFMVLRLRFFWWPLHPAGYTLAVSQALDFFWVPFFISWALKAVILKSGQIKGYHRAIPFFLGMILGDFVIGSLLMIFGAVTGQRVYRIYI